MPELSALILTYNEGPSIGPVVQKVLDVLRRLDAGATVVVVDGGSADGTEENARAAGAVVFRQREKGYGAAFREGLEHMQSRYVLTLDADMSHDPELASMLWDHREEADIVIASRYIAGGSAALTPFRRFLSWFMNGTYRTVLELPIKDMSSGYRLYRRQAVENMGLVSHDFDVLEEVLVKACNRGYRVLEVPFHFEPRQHGESHLQVVKFGLSYYRTLVRLSQIRYGADAADQDLRAPRSLVPQRRVWAWRRRHLVRRLRRRSATLLDLGGTATALGADAGTVRAGSLAGQVVVADARPERLRALEERAPVCLLVSPHHLPFADDSMPGILCSSPSFADPAAWREMYRITAPGGRIVVLPERMGTDVEYRLRAAGFDVVVKAVPPARAVLIGRKNCGGVGADASALCPRCARALVWDGREDPPACVCGRTVALADGGYDFRPSRAGGPA